MDQVKTVVVGAFIMGFGGVIYAIITSFFFPLLGFTVKPVSSDWASVFAGIFGIIMFAQAIIIRNQGTSAKREENLKKILEEMRAPTKIDTEQNEKIEYHDKELLEHYKLIQQNSKDIEIIRNEVKGMRGEVTEFKKFIEERFSDLKEFIRKTK